MNIRVFLCLFLVFSLAGCTGTEVDDHTYVCTSNSECLNGWTCQPLASEPTKSVCVEGAGGDVVELVDVVEDLPPDLVEELPPDVVEDLAPDLVEELPTDVDVLVDVLSDCTQNNCSAAATCTNTEGGFTCACNTGYTGDGVTCVDDDECMLNTDNCSAAATCTNTAGGFSSEAFAPHRPPEPPSLEAFAPRRSPEPTSPEALRPTDRQSRRRRGVSQWG